MLHAYFKNLRVDKLLVLLLTIVTTVIIFFVYYDRTGNAEWVSTVSGLYEMRHIGIPLKLFYEIQDTGYDLWFTLLIFFLSSNLFSADLFIFRKTKFDVLMKLRKKPRQYYLQSFLINFLLSFGYFLILQLTILLTCRVLIGPFYIEHIIQVDTTEINALSTNLILNLVIYISLSVRGMAIFSTFIFSIKRFIHNIYVFRGMGIIIGIVLTSLPAIFFVGLFTEYNQEIFLLIGSFFFVPNLFNPRIQQLYHYQILGSPYVTFFAVSIFVLIVSLIMYTISIKLEQKYE